jgi:hypothetical protein
MDPYFTPDPVAAYLQALGIGGAPASTAAAAPAAQPQVPPPDPSQAFAPPAQSQGGGWGVKLPFMGMQKVNAPPAGAPGAGGLPPALMGYLKNTLLQPQPQQQMPQGQPAPYTDTNPGLSQAVANGAAMGKAAGSVASLAAKTIGSIIGMAA